MLPAGTSKENGNNTALVTGGAGFIGSNLCRSLLGKGMRVCAADNLITGRKENVEPFLPNSSFSFFEVDISSPEFISKLGDMKVREIYHLACPTGVPNIITLGEEMLLTNSLGTINVLELAKKNKSKVLFTSTAEVYGDPEVSPQTEEYTGNVSPVGPRSPYEEGKRFSESLVSLYVKKYDLDAKIVRVFNTYGPGMWLEDFRVIPQFIRSVLTGDQLRIYGDGLGTRTHLYIDDLVKGLLIVSEKGKSGEVYNIGSEIPTTVKELAELVIEITESDSDISFEPNFIEDHRHRLPSVEKVKALGWKQKVELREGLRRMLDVYSRSVEKPEAVKEVS